MGRRIPAGGLLRYRKRVLQQLGDVNKQGSGDSWPIGARHSDTAANHMDLQSMCGRPCVFAVRLWSNLWDLIWLRTSHYSMVWILKGVRIWFCICIKFYLSTVLRSLLRLGAEFEIFAGCGTVCCSSKTTMTISSARRARPPLTQADTTSVTRQHKVLYSNPSSWWSFGWNRLFY